MACTTANSWILAGLLAGYALKPFSTASLTAVAACRWLAAWPGVQRATVYCTRSAEDTTSTPIPLTSSMVPASTLETTGRLEPAEYSIAMLLAPCSKCGELGAVLLSVEV